MAFNKGSLILAAATNFELNAVLVKLLPDPYQSRYNLSTSNVNRDTSSSVINSKPTGAISAININRETSSYKGSMPNQWARSQLSMSTGTQALSDQYPTKGYDHKYYVSKRTTLLLSM